MFVEQHAMFLMNFSFLEWNEQNSNDDDDDPRPHDYEEKRKNRRRKLIEIDYKPTNER